MSRPRLKPPSFATVIAGTALFVALGGGAYAATKVMVNTDSLVNGSVTNHKLANGAVGQSKLSSGLRIQLGQHNGVGPQGLKGGTGGQGPAGANGPKGGIGPAGAAGTNGSNGTDGTNGTNGRDGTNGANPGAAVINVPAIMGNGTPANSDNGAPGDQGFYLSGQDSGGSAALTNGELELHGTGTDGATPQGGIGLAKSYNNVPLGNLNALSYDYHVNEVNGTQAPTIHISVTGAVVGTDSKFASGFTNLVYAPGLNGVTPSESTVYQADAFAPGALWYSTGAVPNSPTTVGSQDDPIALSQFVTRYPKAVIAQISIDNGGSSGSTGSFDAAPTI